MAKLSPQQIGDRIDFIAKILIVLAVIWFGATIISALLNPTDFQAELSSSKNNPIIDGVMMSLQILLGWGLIKRKIDAYYAFRILGGLVLVGVIMLGIVMLAPLPLTIGMYVTLISSPIVGILLAAGALIQAAAAAFWIYGLAITNPKEAKELFTRK